MPQQPDGEPLPSGVIAADGTYVMKVRRSDYEGENTTVDDEFGGDRWSFRTECAGTDCTIQMRRELGSGGFKALSLRPSTRPNVFEAESKGPTNCATNKRAPTKQRYSVKLNDPIDVAGRHPARMLDAFFTDDQRLHRQAGARHRLLARRVGSLTRAACGDARSSEPPGPALPGRHGE